MHGTCNIRINSVQPAICIHIIIIGIIRFLIKFQRRAVFQYHPLWNWDKRIFIFIFVRVHQSGNSRLTSCRNRCYWRNLFFFCLYIVHNVVICNFSIMVVLPLRSWQLNQALRNFHICNINTILSITLYQFAIKVLNPKLIHRIIKTSRRIRLNIRFICYAINQIFIDKSKRTNSRSIRSRNFLLFTSFQIQFNNIRRIK